MAWLAFRRLRLGVEGEVARDLEQAFGLSMADYDVLCALEDADEHGVRLGALADSMFWSQSRLSWQLSRMHRRDLVEKVTAADDRRGVSVRLTSRGRQTIVGAAPEHVASVRRHFIDLLTDEQMVALASAADVVLEHVDTSGVPRDLDAG